MCQMRPTAISMVQGTLATRRMCWVNKAPPPLSYNLFNS